MLSAHRPLTFLFPLCNYNELDPSQHMTRWTDLQPSLYNGFSIQVASQGNYKLCKICDNCKNYWSPSAENNRWIPLPTSAVMSSRMRARKFIVSQCLYLVWDTAMVWLKVHQFLRHSDVSSCHLSLEIHQPDNTYRLYGSPHRQPNNPCSSSAFLFTLKQPGPFSCDYPVILTASAVLHIETLLFWD